MLTIVKRERLMCLRWFSRDPEGIPSSGKYMITGRIFPLRSNDFMFHLFLSHGQI